MKQETYMLPVRCKGCNTMFDLWPILQEQEQTSQVLAENHFAKLLNQSFCRNCRQAVLLGTPGQEEFEDDGDEEATETEIEMMLELDE